MNEINLSEAEPVYGTPWDKPWPANELENVPTCPACGCAERTVLYEQLIDNVFFVAMGKWTLHRCARCSSAYLDPRPSPASIGMAYGNYYTHAAGPAREASEELTGLRRLRRMLANGYLNDRFGTTYQPSSSWGRWIAQCLPGQRQLLDAQFRYLPKPRPGQRLLDIGCGNGDFLAVARDAGWVAVGLEPDAQAAATARQRGFDVQVGSLAELADAPASFDAITLNHVIEHVHQPAETLGAVFKLLRAGGSVHLETPNIHSHGAEYFGADWRGLESPRHLVIFNPSSLASLLARCGFEGIAIKRRPTVSAGMYLRSLRMRQGQPPEGIEPATLPFGMRLRLALRWHTTARLEFIGITAVKRRA